MPADEVVTHLESLIAALKIKLEQVVPVDPAAFPETTERLLALHIKQTDEQVKILAKSLEAIAEAIKALAVSHRI